MILLAGLVRLPLVAGDGDRPRPSWGCTTSRKISCPVSPEMRAQSNIAWLWTFLDFGGAVGPMAVLYSIIPWIGVMALGYAFGSRLPARAGASADKSASQSAVVRVALFLVLRWPSVSTATRDHGPAALGFLATQQVPWRRSLFLLMTLGPTIALVPLLEPARGWWADALAVFGRVPFFFYPAPYPGDPLCWRSWWCRASGPRLGDSLAFREPSHGGPLTCHLDDQWSLLLLYLVFVVTIVILLFPLSVVCRSQGTPPRQMAELPVIIALLLALAPLAPAAATTRRGPAFRTVQHRWLIRTIRARPFSAPPSGTGTSKHPRGDPGGAS